MVLSGAARAAINYQDMWWNPNESGWGVNVAQQNNVMFATWFIYQGAERQPLWVVMPNAPRSGAAGNVFTGDLYRTTGTPFSALPFDPRATTATRVGSATFTFADARTGTLAYDIDGARVTKQITRQTLAALDFTGTYYGGIARSAAGCLTPGLNGSSAGSAIYSIAHTPATNSLAITEVGGAACRYTGVAQQFGSVLEVAGTYACAGDGTTGTFTGAEGTVGDIAFGIRLALKPGGDTCTIAATLGGFRQ